VTETERESRRFHFHSRLQLCKT